MTRSLRQLIRRLRREGVTIEKTKGRGVRITPRSKVPPADLARLTEARDDVRRLLDDDDDDERVADAVPVREYRALGLIRFRGHLTHPLGDDHAARILNGAIALDDARREAQRAQRPRSRMRRWPLSWRP